MGLNGGKRSVGAEMAHAIGDFVAAASGCDRVEILDLSPLAGGAVQENWALDVELAGGDLVGRHALVLRTDPPSRIPASLARGEEFAVLQAAFAAGVTVPEPLWLCDDEDRIGRAFYVMRRVSGVAAGHRLVKDPALDAVRESLVDRLGAELARLHTVRPPFPGLEFLAQPGQSPALDRVNVYRDYLDRMPEPQPGLEWALRWLERRRPRESEVVLCHGDFRTGNYMVDAGAITGILDWEFAAWSDPMEDIGWFCARCWRFGRNDREAGGMGDREAFYRAYERASGRAVDRAGVGYWEVMATVRWAVIALQQAYRHVSGEQESLELALTGHLVPELELDALVQIDAIRARA